MKTGKKTAIFASAFVILSIVAVFNLRGITTPCPGQVCSTDQIVCSAISSASVCNGIECKTTIVTFFNGNREAHCDAIPETIGCTKAATLIHYCTTFGATPDDSCTPQTPTECGNNVSAYCYAANGDAFNPPYCDACKPQVQSDVCSKSQKCTPK